MSASSPSNPLSQRTRANLAAAAVPAFDINHFLATLPPPATASQPVPNPTKARQTVPDSAPAPNKPNPISPTRAAHLNPPPQSSILHPPSSSSVDRPAPNSAKARHDPHRRRTNPPRPLTADQLRAVSFLVDGASTTTIAHALCINRHTLARWKRHPLFQEELRRFIRVPIACR